MAHEAVTAPAALSATMSDYHCLLPDAEGREEMGLTPREEGRGKSACLALAPLHVLVQQLGKVKDDATGSQRLWSWADLNLERLGPKPCYKGKYA